MTDTDPIRVASVDFGQNANVTVVGTIPRDEKTPPTIENIFIATLGKISGSRDAEIDVKEQFAKLPRCSCYLLEEQPRNNAITMLLETATGTRADSMYDATVIHVPVSRVANLFALPKDHAAKKKAAADIVERLMKDDTRAIFHPDAVRGYEFLKRKHDVADAVLQFLWYHRIGMREMGMPKGIVRATDPRYRSVEIRRDQKKVDHGTDAYSKLFYAERTMRRRKSKQSLKAPPPPPKRRRLTKK
jgi:hypothetical protein